MIGYLVGTVIDAGLVLTTSGVGYVVSTPFPLELGEEVSLYTHMVVRETAMQLYGFLNTEDRDIFLKMQSVQGVGPAAAIGILSTLGRDNFIKSVQANDVKTISSAPGIGKKTAEKICVSLDFGVSATTNKPSNSVAAPVITLSGVPGDLAATLMNLGWEKRKAEEAAVKVCAAFPEEKDEGILVRKALGGDFA